jgi:hypothetical protein
MDKLRGKNVTFFMQDELDEYSINLEMWNMALGELEKQNRKTIKEALNISSNSKNKNGRLQ